MRIFLHSLHRFLRVCIKHLISIVEDYPAYPVLVLIQLIIMQGEDNRSGVQAESNDRIQYDLKEAIRSL